MKKDTASIRWFKDQTYNFEILRTLGESTYGGAEIGEVLSAIKGVKSGDDEAWYEGWKKVASMVENRAKTFTDSISYGNAMLRASNYYRTAEFFMNPADERRMQVFDKSVETFYDAMDHLSIKYKKMKIPYETGSLKAVYFPGGKGAENKPLLLAHGGYDSTLEELYSLFAAAALQRSYSTLIFEGPGQGSAIRKHNMKFIPEWEKPTGVVLDAFIAKFGKPNKIVLMGASMGGYLAPRAAAYEKRIDGVVAFDVCFDFQEAALRKAPGFVIKWFNQGKTGIVDKLLTMAMKSKPGIRWGVQNAKWTMGAKSPSDLLGIFKKYNLREASKDITCDVLIAAGEKDHHFPIQQVYTFQKAMTNAKSVTSRIFTEREGGQEHCQMGNISLFHELLFEWLEKTFK